MTQTKPSHDQGGKIINELIASILKEKGYKFSPILNCHYRVGRLPNGQLNFHTKDFPSLQDYLT